MTEQYFDYPDNSSTEREEKSYRRGYHQGAFIAYDAIINENVPASAISRWIDKIANWRRKKLNIKGRISHAFPPDPPYIKKSSFLR